MFSAFPEITLTCKTGQSRCNLNDVRCNMPLTFQCTVMNCRTPFTIIWLVDDVIVKEETNSLVPSSHFVRSRMQYKANGTERNFTCQVKEESFTTGRNTLHFIPTREGLCNIVFNMYYERQLTFVLPFCWFWSLLQVNGFCFADTPSVKIFRGGKIVRNSVTVNNNETTLFTCIATNVTLPAKVFWDVDNRQIYTENEALKLRCGVEIHLNFLPNRAIHTVSCVYKSHIFDEIRTNITLYSTNNGKDDNIQSLHMWIGLNSIHKMLSTILLLASMELF